MQTYDILTLVLLLAATIWGARRGLAKQLATLASLVVGYAVAIHFREPVSQVIDAPQPWNVFAAMLGLFMATSLVIWVGFQFVQGTIEKAGLGAFDTQMGGVLGLVKGLALAMVITMFAVVMAGDTQRTAVLSSFSGYNICRLLSEAHSVVPSEWQQVMEPYFETIKEHQQFVEQPLVDENPDPFELGSPSDTETVGGPSRYDDPLFGNDPPRTDPLSASDPFRRWQDSATRSSDARATLLEPVFDR